MTSFSEFDLDSAVQSVLCYHNGDVEKAIRGSASLLARIRRLHGRRRAEGSANPSLFARHQSNALELVRSLKAMRPVH